MSAATLQPVQTDWEILDKRPNSAEALALVEQRLPTSVIDSLLALGFERAEVFSVVLPARTLQHRRSRNQPLTVDESDKAIRLLRVLKAPEAVYETRESALDFLRRPNPRLDPALRNVLFAQGGRPPIPLLSTDAGARSVEEPLIQMDDGMYIGCFYGESAGAMISAEKVAGARLPVGTWRELRWCTHSTRRPAHCSKPACRLRLKKSRHLSPC